MDNDILGGEIIPTSLIVPTGEKIRAEFHVWKSAPDNPAHVQLGLHFGTTKITVVATNFFAAMCAIRRGIETIQLRLNCYGASRNVQASPMPFILDKGEKVFRLKLGEEAQTSGIVSIFDTGTDVDPVTFDEQQAFFEAWKRSI